MTGLTSILGSGWLLSTQKISEIAGPAGLLAWGLGMLVALLISLFYIEIGSCYPSAGGIGYYSHITHGRFCGFITSWINWLSIVAVPPVEAQAIVQYLSQLTPNFQALYDLSTHALTGLGIAFAIFFMFLFMFINYWSVQVFIRFNNFFTVLKVLVPLLTIGTLFYLGLHPSNFGMTSMQAFLPFGWKAVFVSVISCGVVMSFNGFQAPLTFSEEISNPKRMLPIAVVGSILIAFVIYVLLQIVFIGSLSPSQLSAGWSAINFRSPYVELLLFANFHLVVLSIYMGAVISPGACGAVFTASSARILYSLSKEKHLPKFLSNIHPIHHNPRNAIITCAMIGCIFLLLFKGWYQLVAVISVVHIFSYIPAPIIVLANRLKHNDRIHDNQFKLPFAKLLSPIALFILSILLFYAAWPLTGEMALLIVPGLFFYAYYEHKNYGGKNFLVMFRGASWLIMYLFGISVVVFLGDNPGIGHNYISTSLSMVLLALLSLWTNYFGVKVVEIEEREAALELEKAIVSEVK